MSLSSILHPSCKLHDFLESPLEPDFELEALTALVPSKFWQKARMLTFLKVLTELDCELDWDALLLDDEPLGPLLWLELELEAEEDEDELEVSSTFLKITPAKA